jgi:prevent-host-death family protein
MDQVSITGIPDNLADALNRVASTGERIVLTRRGKSVAVLVPMEDLDQLRLLEDKADLKAARKAQKEKGGITLDAYRKKHGL